MKRARRRVKQTVAGAPSTPWPSKLDQSVRRYLRGFRCRIRTCWTCLPHAGTQLVVRPCIGGWPSLARKLLTERKNISVRLAPIGARTKQSRFIRHSLIIQKSRYFIYQIFGKICMRPAQLWEERGHCSLPRLSKRQQKSIWLVQHFKIKTRQNA